MGVASVKNYGHGTAHLRNSSGKVVLSVPPGQQYENTGSYIYSVTIDC
ncbi:hypothetical protein ABZT47_20585 [Sphaerisporangium sp. NPDC005289]